MNTDFSKFKLSIGMDEAVRSFDCIEGVAYLNKQNEEQLLVPEFTRTKCLFVDCRVYNRLTMQFEGVGNPYSTSDLGEPLGYFPPEKNSNTVQVKHWDAYHVPGTIDTHELEVEDNRSLGQAAMTLQTNDAGIDDMLSVTMEVNTNPVNGTDHVPCAHVHFNGDQVAFSLFKVGDKILLRPEVGVEISEETIFVNGYGEQVTWFN